MDQRSASDRYLVISADCHAGIPYPGLRPYFEKKHQLAFDDFCARRPGAVASQAALAGDFSALAKGSQGTLSALGMDAEAAGTYATRSIGALEALFDSDVRLANLDAEGIAGEVIFPDGLIDNSPPFSEIQGAVGQREDATRYDYELRLAGARAYNRWLAEFCASASERRAGVVYLPPAYDIGAVIGELRRARDEGLRGGFLVPVVESNLPPLHDPYYEPLWSVAEELRMPATLHGGIGEAPDHEHMYQGQDAHAFVLAVAECQFWDLRPFYYFLWGGILERHPGLQLVFAEQHADWVPHTLARMDEIYDSFYMAEVRKQIRRRPSDYWRRQCHITATFMSRGEVQARHDIGFEHLHWGSDYPHPEGTWPYTKECMRHVFANIPEPEVRRILGENALALYGFDRDALTPLAEKIGPSVSEVDRPLEERPRDYIGSGLR